jgi:hypothetical protein
MKRTSHVAGTQYPLSLVVWNRIMDQNIFFCHALCLHVDMLFFTLAPCHPSVGLLFCVHCQYDHVSTSLSSYARGDMQHEGFLLTSHPFLPNRLLSHTIRTRLLNPAALPLMLQAVRNAIFPNNMLGPPRVPPSHDETIAIKHECARVVVEAVPEYVRSRFFATSEFALMQEDVEATLDLFADSYINKHLLMSIVELIVVRLFPELK